jgi:N-acyl-D-aspartate/D-glutamate deacylase
MVGVRNDPGHVGYRAAILASILSLLLACQMGTGPAQTAIQVDILIANGTVFSGIAGDALQPVDVGVKGQKIVYVGNADKDNVDAATKIDATGLIVTPGFIDPHTHSLNDLLSENNNSNLNYVMQGVTTVLNGNDGEGPSILDDTIRRLEANGIGTNTALFVGHGSLRDDVMSGENRTPTEQELAQMLGLVADAMQSGALGLSTGLYYAPGNFAKTDEVIALARVASEYGGVYDTHMRDESTYNIGLLAAIEETLQIGREANIPVHISHIKALGVDVWGQSAAAIELIETARRSGQAVTADQYPWRASGTHLRNTVLPRKILSGSGDQYLDRLRDPKTLARIRSAMEENLRRRGGADSLLIVVANDQEIMGLTLAEVAETRGQHPIDCAIEVMLDGSTRVASFNMHPDDIEAFMQRDWVMTSSDGTDGHPRKYASFPKKYRDYVVDKAVISIEEFLYRSSGLTAETFGLKNRGRIDEAYAADIIIFDPDKFAPIATFETWNELSVGIMYSIINGQLVVSDRRFTGKLPGQVLKRQDQLL